MKTVMFATVTALLLAADLASAMDATAFTQDDQCRPASNPHFSWAGVRRKQCITWDSQFGTRLGLESVLFSPGKSDCGEGEELWIFGYIGSTSCNSNSQVGRAINKQPNLVECLSAHDDHGNVEDILSFNWDCCEPGSDPNDPLEANCLGIDF